MGRDTLYKLSKFLFARPQSALLERATLSSCYKVISRMKHIILGLQHRSILTLIAASVFLYVAAPWDDTSPVRLATVRMLCHFIVRDFKMIFDKSDGRNVSVICLFC